MEVKEAFDKYVSDFDFKVDGIEYKYYHSYRVQKYSEKISDMLNLGLKDKKLASDIGLLHDIGRFHQLEKYNSFCDKKFDHADYGAKILFEDNLILNYDINKCDYEIVKKAIRNHNKYQIEDGLNERELFFAKLVRDADKIDILNAFSSIRVLEICECDEEISPSVREEFFNNITVRNVNVKNKNDKIISMLAFLFDINFEVSYRIIKEEDFINKFYDAIKHKEIFKEYFDYANKYLDEVLKNVG
ncbi:MAG: HD domain-containing protein [Bacillales bacterium]|nr:HD domain-containing protein [Bacillales bacterium]